MHSPVLDTVIFDLTLFLVVFISGMLGARLAEWLKVPDVVLFLLVGIALGPVGVNYIHLSSGSLINMLVLIFGASFIIFHGGLITHLNVIKNVWLSITLLSTTGLIITAIVTGFFAQWILGVSLISALLLGALLASTDPAALVPIFQKFPIRQRVAQTVISESAFTDATGAILTSVVLGIIATQGVSAAQQSLSATIGNAVLDFLWLALAGIVVGAAIGVFSLMLLSLRRGGIFQEYAPMVIILAVLSSYLFAEAIHASGFMSVFVAGIVIGNSKSFRLPLQTNQEHQIHEFVDPISLKLRMLIFIFLGSQVDFSLIQTYGWQAILVVIAFMFVARPLTVLFSLVPDRRAKWRAAEMVFFCWTRETGVIAAALIGMIGATGLAEAKLFSAIVCVVILVTLLLQASTTPWLAKKLKLIEPK